MLTYFVQVNVCWLLFYGAYFALLSRETFFRLNRIWLIISLLGGLILPLVAPTFEVVEPTNVAVVMLQPLVVTAVDLGQNLQNTEGSLFKILATIYGLGLAVTLGKLLFGLWKIKRLHQRAERLPMPDFTLLQVRETIAPFSFFRWVFINLNLIQSADLQQIIMHERAHVRERHSFDVVFAELLGVVFWWSPLVYFYTKSLKNVHEYAADAAVLRTSSPPQYGRLLLRQQQFEMPLSLTNPFFSQLKKRILMMTRNPSKRRALAKYALAVPIFLVLTLLLASPKTKIMATTEAATERAVASLETFEKDFNNPQVIDNELITPDDLANVNDTSITGNQERVFTLDVNTPSSEWVMSVQEIRSMKRFTDKGTLFSQYGKIEKAETVNLTITRISKQGGTTKVSNNIGAGFTKEMADLLDKAELGDTYQFKSQAKVIGETKIQDFPTFTFFIGETPTQFKTDAISAQQKAELLKISESPVVLLAGKRGGVITPNDLAQQDKLEAFQVINGKTVAVEIQSFVMFRIERGGKSTQSNNAGSKFSEATNRLVEAAKVGDVYQFMHLKCQVNYKTIASVDVGSMSFLVSEKADISAPFVPSNADNIKVTLSGKRGGVIGLEELNQQDKLEAVQMVNGQNIPVEIVSFVMFRVPRLGDPQQSNNQTGQFNTETKKILSMANSNDFIQFIDVKCRIKGETVTQLGLGTSTMGFIIKGTPQYNAPKDSSDPVFTKADYEPTFVGGQDSMFRFLGRNIKYPAEARDLRVEGTVYLEFIVEKDGSLTNVKVQRNVAESKTRVDTIQQYLPKEGITKTRIVKHQDESCAEEALRVVKLMPKWRPGLLKGAPIRVCYILPIKFKLE